jgi:hypothetical protein
MLLKCVESKKATADVQFRYETHIYYALIFFLDIEIHLVSKAQKDGLSQFQLSDLDFVRYVKIERTT